MTQQPYGQQPYYPPQPQAPAYPPAVPAQQYPPQPPQQPYYPPQAPAPQAPYGGAPAQPAPPQQPPAVPAQPLAKGTLDDYFTQPSAGSGPGIAWSDKAGNQKPIGTTYHGVVARDVTQADIEQQIGHPSQGSQPLFFRDGRPKLQMKVPLRVPVSEEFPQGEATLYVKGQTRDELTRAMNEAGLGTQAVPKAGDQISIQLVQRRPNPGRMPSNIVAIRYVPAGGAQQGAQQAPAQPVQQPAPQAAPAQPVQQVQPQAPVQQPQAYAPPAAQQVQAPVQQALAPQPGQLAMPEGLSPEQQQLFAQLAGAQGQ